MRTGLVTVLLLTLAGCGREDGATAPVEARDVAAAAIDVPKPDYPERARRSGLEGRVVIEVRVAADGSVTASEVFESSGSDELDEAALEAALAAKFSPARQDGRPVASELLIPYRFKLDDRPRRGVPTEASGWFPPDYA